MTARPAKDQKACLLVRVGHGTAKALLAGGFGAAFLGFAGFIEALFSRGSLVLTDRRRIPYASGYDFVALPWTRIAQLEGASVVKRTSTAIAAPSAVLFVPDTMCTRRLPPRPSGKLAQLWPAAALATSPETLQSYSQPRASTSCNEAGPLGHPQHFFMLRGGHQPLAGNGVILSLTEDGEEAPCTLPLEWVTKRVDFMDLHAVRCWARSH